jgi:predicted pyridoxine 5'-phosphate oxidase superfamily flavin-nucleotide-binding protein
MEDGEGIGLLGIDLSNRRRNRLNGTILRDSTAGFAIAVGQSYGNCPRYIQLRRFVFTREPSAPSPIAPEVLEAADPRVVAMVGGADTFFVATYVADAEGHHAVDVSHRGGKPGFVRLGADGVLTVPDFAGNLFFNTLGNMLVNPKTGLVFIDFETGDLLQMTGDAELILESPEIAAFEGAERLWRFRPRRIIYRAQGLPLRWETPADGASPFSQETGSWSGALPIIPRTLPQETRP